MNVVSFIYGIFSSIFMVFIQMLQVFNWTKEYLSFDHKIAMEVFKSMITSVLELSDVNEKEVVYERKDFGRKIRIGLD